MGVLRERRKARETRFLEAAGKRPCRAPTDFRRAKLEPVQRCRWLGTLGLTVIKRRMAKPQELYGGIWSLLKMRHFGRSGPSSCNRRLARLGRAELRRHEILSRRTSQDLAEASQEKAEDPLSAPSDHPSLSSTISFALPTTPSTSLAAFPTPNSVITSKTPGESRAAVGTPHLAASTRERPNPW